MARIVIADDHVLIREGLRKVLAHEPDIEVVGEAADGESLLALLASAPADVVLMDINMPGSDPVETLARINAARPGMPVLMISMLPEDQVAASFLRLGAAGYVSKQAAVDELTRAIHKVLKGGRYLSAALAERLAASARPRHELLSPRELQVLRLLASGRSVKNAADDLRVSVSTVHTHRARILEKLKLRSDVDLARYAVHNRLVG